MGAEVKKTRGRSVFASGVRDGTVWRKHRKKRNESGSAHRAVQEGWTQKAIRRLGRNPDWSRLLLYGKRYADGFQQGCGKAIRLLPIPLRGTAAAVLYAPPRISMLSQVLKQLRILPLKQIIVVMHNATPAYFAAARAERGVVIAHFPDMPDPAVGRALGAKLCDADSVLFVDAEQPVKADVLARFLWRTDTDLDAALNDVSSRLGLFDQREDVFRVAEFLNTSLKRSDLAANTLSMLPFALSRRAIAALGPALLASPIQAHTAAILEGLRVGVAANVPARLSSAPSDKAEIWGQTAGGLAEAWRNAMSAKGNRLVFPDMMRNRSVIEEWTP